MSSLISITASYAFFPLTEEGLSSLKKELDVFGELHGMKGLVLIAPEGINSTVCGSGDAIAAWKKRMCALKSDIFFKDSSADREVFRRWIVKIKPELITYRQSGIAPAGRRHHLTPREWKQMMEQENAVIIDTRNIYETAIGKFQNAIDPGIQNFRDFPDAIQSANIPKEKTVMLYCTGGIRCEKAVLSLEQQGYKNVYQLEGGILAYLEQYPNDAFEGECFVFDERVAVDQELKPSKTYRLCRECGDTATDVVCAICSANVAAAK